MKRKIGKEPAEYRREQDKKRRKGRNLRNTAGNRTRNGGRVIACGIPQGTGQERWRKERNLRNTAGSRTRNGGRVIACGIPQGAGQKDGASGVSEGGIEWEG